MHPLSPGFGIYSVKQVLIGVIPPEGFADASTLNHKGGEWGRTVVFLSRDDVLVCVYNRIHIYIYIYIGSIYFILVL